MNAQLLMKIAKRQRGIQLAPRLELHAQQLDDHISE